MTNRPSGGGQEKRGALYLKKTLTEENAKDGWNGDACVDVFDSDRWNDGHVECLMATDDTGT